MNTESDFSVKFDDNKIEIFHFKPTGFSTVLHALLPIEKSDKFLKELQGAKKAIIEIDRNRQFEFNVSGLEIK